MSHRSWRSWLFPVAAAVATACGASSQQACDDMMAASNRVLEESQSCTGTATPIAPGTCPGGASLPAACVPAMQDYANCLNSVRPCSSATEPTWANGVDACTTQFSTAFADCEDR